MSDVQIFDDTAALANAAAEKTVKTFKSVIAQYGSAVWVLAGGSTPIEAYKVIASEYTDAIDWSAVTVIMGDERIGPLNGPDNNWHAINEIIGGLSTVKLQPQSDKSADDAAADYEEKLLRLPKGDSGLPRLDVVWAGVGEDSHTLSLFPRHASMLPSGGLVTPVHDAPKPPANRISLSLRAIQGATNLMVLASGENKKAAVTGALNGDHSPIALVANIVSTHEGNVTWFIDKTAAPTD